MIKQTKVFFTYRLNTNLELNNSGGISKALNNCFDALQKRKIESYLITNNSITNKKETITKLSINKFILKPFLRVFKKNKKERCTLVVFGCASLWPYFACFIGLISGMKVFFQPSFHDPNYVIHKYKALLAKNIISFMSILPIKKLKIVFQTNHEKEILKIHKNKAFKAISVNLNKIESKGKKIVKDIDSFKSRKNLICYVGRPTKQKGWDKFLNLLEKTPSNKNIVIVSGRQFSEKLHLLKRKYRNLDIKHNISDQKLYELMKNTKIMFLASDYESLGIAHIEATLLGCFVPLIGRYPFWDEFKINRDNELKLLEDFVKDDKNSDLVIKNKNLKFKYILENNLPLLFDNFINSLY